MKRFSKAQSSATAHSLDLLKQKFQAKGVQVRLEADTKKAWSGWLLSSHAIQLLAAPSILSSRKQMTCLRSLGYGAS